MLSPNKSKKCDAIEEIFGSLLVKLCLLENSPSGSYNVIFKMDTVVWISFFFAQSCLFFFHDFRDKTQHNKTKTKTKQLSFWSLTKTSSKSVRHCQIIGATIDRLEVMFDQERTKKKNEKKISKAKNKQTDKQADKETK